MAVKKEKKKGKLKAEKSNHGKSITEDDPYMHVNKIAILPSTHPSQKMGGENSTVHNPSSLLITIKHRDSGSSAIHHYKITTTVSSRVMIKWHQRVSVITCTPSIGIPVHS